METIELSFSRVQAYLRCPWMYHLIYDQGWRSGPNASMALGQSLHRTLEAYLSKTNTERTLDRLLEIYDQMWVNEGFANPQETLDSYDRGRKMLERFFQFDSSRENEVEATEKKFAIELEPGLAFKGTVDRLDRSPGGSFEIIEYKTEGEHWSEKRMANDLQMTLYLLGLQVSSEGAPLKLKYYFLSTGESKETHRTPTQLEETLSLLKNAAEKIRKKEFAPNHSYCARCEFGKRCVNFKPGNNT